MLTLEKLKAKGIVFEGAKGVMAYDSVNGHIKTNFSKTKLAMDSALQTIPNIGFPASMFQYIDPQIVEILFAVTNANKLAPEVKQGDWTIELTTFAVEERTGDVTAYSDRTENVTTTVNYEYPVREQVRFQTMIEYGDLEMDKANTAKIALQSRKQLAGADIIARKQNQFYLQGVSGKINYGILNEPNLNASIAPITVGGNTTWATKTTADPDNAGNIVYNDILKLWSELASKNGGHISMDMPIKLAISNSMISYLSMPNKYGLTAEAMLKQNFKNIEIIQIPELSTNAGEYLFMEIENLYGVDTMNLAFSEKLRAGRVIQTASGQKQKFVGTSFGCILRRASCVARMLGI